MSKEFHGAYHWHPYQDYCIRCKCYLNSLFEDGILLLISCKCGISNKPHLVFQQICYSCLRKVKEELGVNEILVEDVFSFLGIELPIT